MALAFGPMPLWPSATFVTWGVGAGGACKLLLGKALTAFGWPVGASPPEVGVPPVCGATAACKANCARCTGAGADGSCGGADGLIGGVWACGAVGCGVGPALGIPGATLVGGACGRFTDGVDLPSIQSATVCKIAALAVRDSVLSYIVFIPTTGAMASIHPKPMPFSSA